LTAVSTLQLDLGELAQVGHDLRRPENVLCFRDGTVFASSNEGFLTRISPEGRQWRIGNSPGAAPTTMALESETAIIVNDTADGHVHRMRLDGHYETLIEEIDGQPIGSANYVFLDRQDRLWIAVATRKPPPHETIEVRHDGYIALVEDGTARIIADGLRWPNEVRLDRHESYAYVSETFGQRVLRYRVSGSGDLGDPEVFGPDPLGNCALPDGIALDADGNLWVAIVSRNGLQVIEPGGEAHTVFEQPVPPALAALAAALPGGRIRREMLAACAGPDLKLLTSVGFAGPELKTVVMGSLAMDHLVSFASPVAGLPLRHQARPDAPSQPAIVKGS